MDPNRLWNVDKGARENLWSPINGRSQPIPICSGLRLVILSLSKAKVSNTSRKENLIMVGRRLIVQRITGHAVSIEKELIKRLLHKHIVFRI